VALPEAVTTYGSRAADPFTVAPADIAANQQAWIDEWTAIVLR
jgi:ABC-type thiamine transport system substrate-binding protein